MTLRSSPMARVPVLTEVVEFPVPGRDSELPAPHTVPAVGEPPTPAAQAGLEPAAAPVVAIAAASSAQVFDLNEAQLTQRILADVQRQVDLMLEFRVREALMPALARATEGLVREARSELATTLKDVVTRAVSQELARHRLR